MAQSSTASAVAESKKRRDRAAIARLAANLFRRGRPRWHAAASLTDYAYRTPGYLWPVVLSYGSSEDIDLRQAVATCLLEHILEKHFSRFFPRLKAEIESGNDLLGETFLLCAKFGQSNLPQNSSSWEAMRRRLLASDRSSNRSRKRTSAASRSK